MPLNSVITALLIASIHSKQIALIIPLSLGKRKKRHTEQDQVNMGVVPVQQCSSQPGTVRCLGHCEQVHCLHEAATIFSVTTLISSPTLSEA